jgi:hypothetical protein
MVNQMKSQGHLNAQQKIFSIEEVVQGMLADDPYSLNIFKGEILE